MNVDRTRPERRKGAIDDVLLLNPSRDDRPGMRWWWQSPLPPEALVRELRAIVAAGFGEVEIAFVPGFWATQEQRDGLLAVLEEAERLGVGVATTLGAAWPLQTPNTATGTTHAARELQYGVRFIEPQESVLQIPAPFDDPQLERPSQLLRVTVARVISRGTDPHVEYEQTVFGGTRRRVRGATESGTLDRSSLEDVTSAVTDGSVTWDRREGDWALFAFWARDSAQSVTSFLDRTAAVAATEYLDEHQFDTTISALLRRSGTDLFEDSLELDAESLFWTRTLLERFENRYGYDVTPYLPGLFAHGMCGYWVPNEEPAPDFVFDDGSDRRARRDYYRLLTDLYIEDHLLVLQDWSLGHGMRHKAQVAYGQNLEPVRSNREFVRRGGHVEGESLNSGDRVPMSSEHPNWRFALDWHRSIVAGAHQGGAVRISTELGAQFQAGYVYTLGDYRKLLDKAWAVGITKPFVHGYASQDPDAEWPTQHRFGDFIAESWNDEHFPEWVNWRPLTDYWARGTVVLETGTPRCDVAVYRDGFLTTAARGVIDVTDDHTAPERLTDAEALERAGFSVQFIDPQGIAENGAIGNGTLFPNGPAYRAIIVDERAVPAATAEALDRAAAAGVRVVVVGDPPARDDGLADAAEADRRVASAIERLLSRPTAIRIAAMAEAADALRREGLRPRVAFDDAPLLTQWRDAGEMRYLVIYNTADHPVVTEISLESAGGARRIDLSSGSRTAMPSRFVDGRLCVELEMAALGLHVLEFGELVAVTESPNAGERSGREAPLGDWNLEVRSEEPGGMRSITLPGQGPGDWRDVESLRHVSGIGIYRTSARIPLGAHARLHFDGLAGSAVVRAGGRSFGPVYAAGDSLDLGDALAMDGSLEIEVRTALRNAVVATGLREHVGATTQPQGLLAPVRVEIFSPPPPSDCDIQERWL